MRRASVSVCLTAMLLSACAAAGAATDQGSLGGLAASSTPAATTASDGSATRLAQATSPAPATKPAKTAPAAPSAEAKPAAAKPAEPKGLDCKKLTGRIQLRILQMRADRADSPSQVSETLRQAGAPLNKLMFGGKGGTASASGGARASADRAQIEAYNAELKAKGCRHFDLEAELAKDAKAAVPTPLPKPSNK